MEIANEIIDKVNKAKIQFDGVVIPCWAKLKDNSQNSKITSNIT